jgi:hypothetical protein
MLSLYRTLRQHRTLAEKRDVNFENNQVAKFFVYLVMLLMLVYLMGFAILLSTLVNGSQRISAVEFFFSIMPIILAVDFFVRFVAQQTPAQIVKPYCLLPIPIQKCINGFVFSSLLSGGNLIWFCLIIPYTLMSVVFGYGVVTTLLFWTLSYLLILINSQYYAIMRTLINVRFGFWIIPISVYFVIFAPFYLGSNAGFDSFLDVYGQVGSAIECHSVLPVIGAFAVLCAITWANSRIQRAFVLKELTNTERPKVKHVLAFSVLNRYGEIGTFIKLEIKTILRNKNPRKLFISSSLFTMILSLLISCTEIYDSQFMTSFWAFYTFVLFGSMILVRGLGNEGNFIDGLMVRKEKVLTILRAKYIFYSAIVVFPFLLMLPMVIVGKWPLMMLVSYAIFTVGFQYFILFQLVIYAKQTIPLNEKLISKGGIEDNYIPVVVQIAVIIISTAIAHLLQIVFGDNVAYMVMATIGIGFIATSKMWLRNIYNRFMAHRYTNLEHFRATR